MDGQVEEVNKVTLQVQDISTVFQNKPGTLWFKR